jgi:hypothetical protein
VEDFGGDMMKSVVTWLVLVALVVPGVVAAKSVYLNGVLIDGVKGQRFDNCQVEIDAQGNVLITAKGYEVKTAPAPTATTAPATTPPSTSQPTGTVTRRYFLVSEALPPGMTQYDIDVFVNSVWIKRITGDEPQIVLEISRHLRVGKNAVHVTALKSNREPRKSTSEKHVVKLLIGEGNMTGNQVVIDAPLLEYKRDASEVQNFSDELSVTGR